VAFLIIHVFEDVGLQVAIDNEYGDACNVLERLLVGCQHLFHSLKWDFGQNDLLEVLIDKFNSLNINLGGS